MSLEGLTAVERQIIEMSIRQMSQIENEIGQIEAEIISRGKSAAIGLLVEIGNIELFDISKQLVA